MMDADRNVIWSQNIAEPPNLSAEYSPSNIRDISFAAGLADFQQDGFAPNEVFDGKTEPENGWAVGGRIQESHRLTLVPSAPIEVKENTILRLIVEHNSPYANHLLGRFQVNTTDDASVIERAGLPQNIVAILDKAADQRSAEEQTQLAGWYRDNQAPELAADRKERDAKRQEYNTMKPDTSVPILRELASEKRRKTLFQFRGNYLDKGHEVHEGVPGICLDSGRRTSQSPDLCQVAGE